LPSQQFSRPIDIETTTKTYVVVFKNYINKKQLKTILEIDQKLSSFFNFSHLFFTLERSIWFRFQIENQEPNTIINCLSYKNTMVYL